MRGLSFLVLLSLFSTSLSYGQMKGGVSKEALSFFPNWIEGATPQTHDLLMRDLINPDAPSLNWPPFPRTWLELSLERTQITKTGWVANVTGFQHAVPIFGSTLKVGAQAEFNTEYKYNVATTLIAISSLRPIKPEAKENSDTKYGNLPGGSEPHEDIKSIVKWNEDERRTYFNITPEFPILALCKFEMTLRYGKSSENTLEFLVYKDSNAVENVQTVTHALYSNFFHVRPDIPIQEYLRTTCDEEFKQLVRYFAEIQFNNTVKEIHAHYHPQAQCTLPKPGKSLDPRGDATCMDWFYNAKNVMGSYRRDNIPRCVLGKQGIPQCVLRAKEGASCPVYYSNGQISPRSPFDGSSPMVTKGNYNHYSCDKGYSCKPASGGDWSQFNTNWFTRFTGVDAVCRRNEK